RPTSARATTATHTLALHDALPISTRKRRKTKRSRPSLRGLRTRIPRLAELDQSRRDAVALGFLGLGVLLAFVCYFGWDGGSVGQDRKSTRLNSSHVSISYAVFCLK